MATNASPQTAIPARDRRKRRRIGPKDAGRLMTLEEFERCREKPGFVYELIDGVLSVSPAPKPNHDSWTRSVFRQLDAYSNAHPDRINYVSMQAEVVIPGRPGTTRPRPDVAAYQGYPEQQAREDKLAWEDVCPILVVEIISRRRPRKDTTRNRQLYWMAGGIAEYWILDPKREPARPVLIALRRTLGHVEWVEQKVDFAESYESPTLPGLVVNLAQPAR